MSLEKRIEKLELHESRLFNKPKYKICVIERLSVEEWTYFINHHDEYDLIAIENSDPSSIVARFKYSRESK
jgi:hypothetical protein